MKLPNELEQVDEIANANQETLKSVKTSRLEELREKIETWMIEEIGKVNPEELKNMSEEEDGETLWVGEAVQDSYNEVTGQIRKRLDAAHEGEFKRNKEHCKELSSMVSKLQKQVKKLKKHRHAKETGEVAYLD